MKKIYITGSVPIVNIKEGVIDYVIEVNPEIMYRLWSRFIDDLNNIAESIYSTLVRTDSECLKKAVCRIKLLVDTIVAFIKHLITIPLIPPPEQGSVAKYRYTLHPQDLLIFYTILKGYCTYVSDDKCRFFSIIDNLLTSNRDNELPGIENLSTYYDELLKVIDVLKNVIGEDAYNIIFNIYDVFEEDHTKVCRSEDVYRLGLLRCIPADTRPGLSTSALLIHVLLTSAIARIIKEQSDKVISHDWEVEVLRLASILHDIGKPIAWYKTFTKDRYVSHVDEEVLDDVWGRLKSFEKLLGDDVWGYVKVIVRCHHMPSKDLEKCLENEFSRLKIPTSPNALKILTRLCDYASQADIISSNTDRITSLIRRVLKDIESKCGIKEEELEKGYGESYGAWHWWLSKSDEEVKKIAKAVVETLISEDAQMMLGELREEVTPTKNYVNIGIIDIRGIQRYIDREVLRALIGGSIAIDITTLTIIPAILIKILNLNLEHILYAGGGVVEVLLPRDKGFSKVFTEYYSGLMKRSRWLPEVSCAEVPLTNDWRSTSRDLISKLATVKLLPTKVSKDNIELTDLRVGMVCEVCGRESIRKFKDEEIYTDILMCDTCSTLWNFGESFYVRSKLELLKSTGYDIATKLMEEVKSGKLMRYLMEWLSGSKYWLRGEGTNIAVMKADMNLGGLFMANSLSISEAFTKSVLMDYALKKSLYMALKALKSVFGNDMFVRTYVGIMYAGGDDLLAIVPTSTSLPLTLYTIVTFWTIIGARQLSIAVGVAKPKQNVWNIIDTVTEFLKMSKDYIRSKVGKLSDLTRIVGVLSIIYSDKQLLPAYVSILKKYESQGLTTQPLVLKVSDGNGFQFIRGLNMFTQLLTLFTDDRIDNVRDLIEAIYQGLNIPCLDKSYVGEVIDYIREVYSVARSRSKNKDELLLTIAVYSVNYAVKLRKSENEVTKRFGERLSEFLQSIFSELERERKLPIYDLYLLAKFLEEAECVSRGSKL